MSSGPTPARRRAEAAIGRTLRDKWRLDAVLGVGGIGVVYAATHRAGKRVAIKMLHPELSVHEEIRTRFVREAHVANRIGHPGAVSVSDDDVTEEGEAFLVMDLLEGETLDARRKRLGGALGPVEVLSFADQILDVLAAAHEKDIIHRDLKPENLFLTRDGRVVVLDFGIARMNDPISGESATQTGLAMGTPAFMPPEQARGRRELVDARSDLWALGATMFALLAGRPVHGRLTANEALAVTMTQQAPPLRSVAPGVPEAAAVVIDRALEFEPKMRWADARAMQRAVRGAIAAIEATGTATLPLGVVSGLAAALGEAGLEPELITAALTGAPVSSTGPVPTAEKRPVAMLAVLVGLVAILGVIVALLVRASAGGPAAATQAGSQQAPTVVATAAPREDPTAAATTAEAPAVSAEVPEAETAKPVVVKVPAGKRPAATAATVDDPFAKRTRAPNH